MSACKHCDAPAVHSGLCEVHASLAEHYAREDAKKQSAPTLQARAPCALAPTPAAEVIAPVDTSARARFWIDAVFEQGLSSQAFMVYVYLQRRAGKSRTAWPKLSTIANDCRLDRKTVVSAVARLVELRMMTRKRAAFGKANRYLLLPPEEWRRAFGPSDGSTDASLIRPVERVN